METSCLKTMADGTPQLDGSGPAAGQAEACRLLLEAQAAGLPMPSCRQPAASGAEACRKLLEERAVGLPGRPCRSPLLPLERKLSGQPLRT